jgi:hypothetical protein
VSVHQTRQLSIQKDAHYQSRQRPTTGVALQ